MHTCPCSSIIWECVLIALEGQCALNVPSVVGKSCSGQKRENTLSCCQLCHCGFKPVLLSGWDAFHGVWPVVLRALGIKIPAHMRDHAVLGKSYGDLHLALHPAVAEACPHPLLQQDQSGETPLRCPFL